MAKVPPHPSALRFHQNPTSKYVQKCYKYLKTQISVFFSSFLFPSWGSSRGWEGMVTWIGRDPNSGLSPEPSEPRRGPLSPRAMGHSCTSCSGHGSRPCSRCHQCSLRDQPLTGQSGWETCVFSVRPQLHWVLGEPDTSRALCPRSLLPFGAPRMSLHGARGHDPDSLPLPQSPSVLQRGRRWRPGEGGLGLSVNPWGLTWEGGLQPGTWAGPGAQGKEVE